MAREQGKRPSYQWYPGDFRRDTAVYSLPFPVRSFWREMLDIMHDGEPYGHLTAGGDPIPPADLARMIGVRTSDAVKWLEILGRRNVYSRTPEGVIYCRRMVRDDKTLTARINGGKDAPQPNAKGVGKGMPKGGGKGAKSIPSDPPPAVCSLQSASALEDPPPPDDPTLAFRAAWDAHPHTPKVQEWTEPRRAAIRRALCAKRDLMGLFSAFYASGFLCGTRPRGEGHESFRATVDWCLKPANLVKILEGAYADPGTAPRQASAAPWRPSYRTGARDWCRHETRCGSREWHAMLIARGDLEPADVAEQPA